MSQNEMLAVKSKSISTDIIKMCIVCRMDIKKGVAVVINALYILRMNGYNATLTVVGDGPDLIYFKDLAQKLKLLDIITFTGKLNHCEVLKVMQENDLFCYPTMASEGFPKVVLEAMSQGLVVITTPVSILSTLINNSNGILLEEPSSDKLYNAIINLYSDYNSFVSHSLNAISTSKNYSLENWRGEIACHLEKAWNVDLDK
jgi:glycosyltransferase involved in cell wall biosynthesis